MSNQQFEKYFFVQVIHTKKHIWCVKAFNVESPVKFMSAQITEYQRDRVGSEACALTLVQHTTPITVIVFLFPVTSKVRDYTCQNTKYITISDPSNAALLCY